MTLPGSVTGCSSADDTALKSPRSRITVSRKTTFLTGPLDQRGNVDYIAAINARFSKGITPENNAAVPYWKAVGPKLIPRKFRKEFFRRLGIPPLPETGEYFRPWDLNAKDPDAKRNGRPVFRLANLYEKCTNKPWQAKDAPEIATWLKANTAALRTIERACRMPRFYTPVFVEITEGDFGVYPTGSGQFIAKTARNVARAFHVRATLRMGSSNIDGALDDLLTLCRLSRHLERQPSLVSGLVATATRAMSFANLRTLLAATSLNRQQLGRLQRELRSSETSSAILRQFNFADRCYELMALRYVAAGKLQNIDRFHFSWLGSGKKLQPLWQKHGRKVATRMVDWNAVLRRLNAKFDQMAAISQNPDRPTREKAFKAMQARIAGRLAKKKAFAECLPGDADDKANREGATAWFSDARAIRLLPAYKEAARAVDRDRTRDGLCRIALALAVYRLDHNRYPKQLSELKPKYLNQLPLDRCDGRPMKYRRAMRGYLLYSVGTNGKADAGRGPGDRPYGDDITIRVR